MPRCWAGWAGSGRCAWSASRNRQLRRWPGPLRHASRGAGGGGGPQRPPGPPPAGQVDPLDAVSAARAAQSGRARGIEGPGRRGGGDPDSDGRRAHRRSERTQTINQARSLVLTAPMTSGSGSFTTPPSGLVADLAGVAARPRRHRRLRRPDRAARAGPRAQFLDGELESLDEVIVPLVTAHARACWLDGSAPTPQRCCSSRRATTGGCAGGRLGAPVRRRPDTRFLGKTVRRGSTPAATGKPTHALWRIVDHPVHAPATRRPTWTGAAKEGLSKKGSSAA